MSQQTHGRRSHSANQPNGAPKAEGHLANDIQESEGSAQPDRPQRAATDAPALPLWHDIT